MSVVQTHRDLGAKIIWRPRSKGTFHALAGIDAANLSNASVSAGIVRYLPVMFMRPMKIDRMGVFQSTFAAGTAQVGIYGNLYSGGADIPRDRLAFASFSTASAPSDAPLLFTFEPGVLYWVAHTHTAAVQCSTHPPTQLPPLGRSTGTTQFTHRIHSGSSLPVVAPSTTLTTGAVVAIFGREA